MPKNPYLALYATRIAECAGKYPLRDFSVFYNEDEYCRAKDVTAIFIPYDAPGPGIDLENRLKYAAHIADYSCSLDGHSDTAINIFNYLLKDKGFSSKKDEARALDEFAKIEGWNWPTDQL